MDVVLMLMGFVLLVVGGDFLVRASVALSLRLNISKMVIGFTALIGTIYVDKTFYKFNWPVLMLFSMLFYYFLSNDNKLSTLEGAILFIGLIVFVISVLRKSSDTEPDDSIDELTVVSNFKIGVWLFIGGAALYFGSDWLVKGAIVIAKEIGVSEAVISVSIIAVGTSVPELAASVMAVVRNEKAISLGNLIGSNIFNIGSVLGLTAMIKPIIVEDPLIVSRDLIWMLVFAAILLPLAFILKRHELKKTEGFAMVFMYGIFIYLVFIS